MVLQRSNVQRLIEDALGGVVREDCRACECFLGFIARLKLDCREDISDITGPLMQDGTQIHGCLGCDPCPPDESFTKYLRGIRSR